MSLFNLFKNLVFTEPNQVKLTVTSDLSFLSNTDKDDLMSFYNDEDPIIRLSGSILNALYTQKKTTFLFSKRICCELLKKDSRQSRKTVDTITYKALLHFLLKNEIVKILKESSRCGGNNSRGSILEIVAPTIIQKIETLESREYLDQQRIATIKFYDSRERLSSTKKRKKIQKSQPSSPDIDIVTATDADADSANDSRSIPARDSAPDTADLLDCHFKKVKPNEEVSAFQMYDAIQFLVNHQDKYSDKIIGIRDHIDRYGSWTSKQEGLVMGRAGKLHASLNKKS